MKVTDPQWSVACGSSDSRAVATVRPATAPAKLEPTIGATVMTTNKTPTIDGRIALIDAAQ
jgi:hypothetical protein